MKNNVENLIMQHRSVRKYTKEEVTEESIREMIKVSQCAASSHFVQAYSIIIVKDGILMYQLSELTGNRHVSTCSKFLVFCADLERLNIACQMHHKKIKSESAENLLVSTIDTALLAQNFSLVAESRGYGICFIGGVRNNPIAISELLKLPQNVFPLFGMTVGVPDEQNDLKPRLPIEAIVHSDGYDSSEYEDILRGYNATMKKYYQMRDSNQKDINWTESMSEYMSVKNRPDMKYCLNERGFIKD